MNREAHNSKIDEYIARSRELNGQIVSEREQWNTCVSADAIRHFAYGIGDDNPLWLDRRYARRSRYGRLAAPPSFLASVLYPGLHGFPMAVPLSSLISELGFEWYRPQLEGETLHARARQLDVRESTSRQGRRLVYVLAEVTYSNDRGEVVGKANSTIARVQHDDPALLVDRPTYRYSDSELQTIKDSLRSETRTGRGVLTNAALRSGCELPTLVRGPLTVGDLITWQSAIGPAYRAAALAFRDTENAPHTSAIHPITGWPYSSSQQHEDSLLARARGMPAPFDNTVQRFAWISTMLTNWMGDAGSLRSLRINAIEPVLYGDTNWYRGVVVDSEETDLRNIVRVRITGKNQLGQITTDGLAEVAIPAHVGRGAPRSDPSDAEQVDAPDGSGFLDAFRAQVLKYPSKPAVVCGARSLSYRELDEQSTLLSGHLRKKNTGPGSRVGVLLARSTDAIIALMAVLKTGATYVPLNSEYPRQALSRVIEEARVDYFLAHSTHEEQLRPFGTQTTYLDPGWQSGIQARDHERETPANGNSIAYIMFTSGTTGTPKAVAVTYRSLNLYLGSMSEALNIGPGEVYLNTAPFSYSASTRQTLLPLRCGCTMVLADEEQRRNQHALLTMIKDKRVTVWDTVPTSIRLCMDYLMDRDAEDRAALLSNHLRSILSTGEALPWSTPFTWNSELAHTASFFNLYSQTETSGTVCLFKVPAAPGVENGVVPLGKPLEDTPIYILDQAMEPVPAGEVGELYVGGDRLALGYDNDPRLSGETFVPDPFVSDPRARLYRTGDLVYELPDGNLQSRGRADTRVNVDGYRIELTAIEALLETCSEVREAAVTVGSGNVRRRQLVGYVVPVPQGHVSTGKLRRFLKDKLPGYMIPTVFVPIDKLPRTATGKVDRRILADLGGPADPAHAEAVPGPASPTEKTLLDIWKQVMDLDSLGVNDDFFELGGHSLQATQISLRINEKIGPRINMGDLFIYSSVRELAAYVETT